MSSNIYIGKRVSLATLKSTDQHKSATHLGAVGVYGANKLVKCGYLWKSNVGRRTTTRSSVSSRSRYFVVTKSTLDYYRSERCEKLRGNFPLANVVKVCVIPENPAAFLLHIAHEDVLLLDAGCRQQCSDWVKAIHDGVSSWSVSIEREADAGEEAYLDEGKDVKFPSLDIPSRISPSDAPSYLFGEFPMIKYSDNGKAIPRENIFMLDSNYLHLMWKKVGRMHEYHMENTLSLDRIVEVRCGQQTKNFVNFPYLEVERQSFSLMYEKEKGEFSQLCSLDLICDSVLAFQHWKAGLNALIYGDKDGLPMRRMQPLVDPVMIFLKKRWTLLESSRSANKRKISFEQAFSLLKQIFRDLTRRSLKQHIKIFSQGRNGILKASDETFSWDSLVLLFYLMNKQEKLLAVFLSYCKTYPQLGMTAEEFKAFLTTEQKTVCVSVSTCAKLIQYHDRCHWMYKRICSAGDPYLYRGSKTILSFHGFQSFLRSEDNAIFNSEHNEVHQDMDHPLSDYFINSSHNTYLIGRQINGMSSCEAYVRALQQGCRSLEIDCWDGTDEPIVTHGFSLTTKIRLRDVLMVIKEYAFDVSPYPLILSLENHCSEDQQTVMASMFLEIFGDMLATENLCNDNVLPSPHQLMHKVILKGRVHSKKKSRVKNSNVRHQSSSSGKGLLSTNENSSPQLEHKEVKEVKEGEDNPMIQVPLDASMGKLIVYCRSVTYKRGENSSSCCEMHSLAENVANEEMDKYSQEIIRLSKFKLLRSYPKSSRYDSSNFNPMSMWKAGIQMVALNVQKADSGMHVNQGFFCQNGGCGYVLKPKSMQRLGSYFDPTMSLSPVGSVPIHLTLEVLSGQFVDIETTKSCPMTLEIETVGIDADCSISSTEGGVICFDPKWSKTSHEFDILLPELCVVYFKVLANLKVLFQTALPMESIREGIRFVPMRSATGVRHPASGVFVRVSIQRLDAPQQRHSVDASNNAVLPAVQHARSTSL